MKKLFDLQLFAEDATGAAGSDPVTAEKNDNGAAPEQGKDTKDTKDTKAADEKKYTDADLDEIINRKFAKWQKDHEKKVEAAAEEAKKLAEMNAQQKAEYERDKLQKELDEERKQNAEFKRQAALAEMTKTARKMLTDEGISAPDEILARLVTTDAGETKTAIDSYSKAFKEAVEIAVKDRLRGEIPKKGTGGIPAPLTEVEKRIQKYS